MINHKYLEEFGAGYVKPHYRGFKGLIRRFKDRKQYKETGVHNYDCWDLDHTMCLWLYEHICQFYEDASKHIDLEYYRFIYKDKDYSEGEIILKIKEDLALLIECGRNSLEVAIDKKLSQKCFEARKEAFELLGIVAPALWW